jgi:hypothetical protein
VTVPAVQQRFNISYPTAKDDINRLMGHGILEPLSDKKPKSFYSPEIIDIQHGEPNWEEHQAAGAISFSTASARPSGQSPSSSEPIVWQIGHCHPSIPPGDQELRLPGS